MKRAFLRHPSIEALLASDGTTSSPDEAMRRRARALVDRALKLGWEGPPFDLELLASVAGYRVHTETLGEGQDGCVDAVTRRILVSARLPPPRRRFTVAHEVAHTLLPDFGSDVTMHHASAEHKWAEQSPVEQICHVGAAELLMPLGAFRAACGREPISVQGIARVAANFEASFQAVARRWVSLVPSGTSLAVARPMPPDGDLTVIASVRGGTGKPLHLPWGRVLPRGSVAYRVWERAQQSPQRPCTDEAIEYWGSLGRLGRRRVEAATNPLSWATPESVLCLLHELPKR
ncbi:MAG TPA: ImmA/IrrE family metallo-endopeptidase [Longimicrobium sp.]|jgi:hypothetical protein